MLTAAYLNPVVSVTVAIRKEYDNRNLKETASPSFLLYWTYIYRPVLYEVARRVWGGLTADGRV
jgi:hypothetical protein